jgi:hypothetical protein
MNVCVIVRVNRALSTLRIILSLLHVSAVSGHNQVDLTTYMEKNTEPVNFPSTCVPLAGNTFQDPPQLLETADNTERYI